jgi:hypothetical protein
MSCGAFKIGAMRSLLIGTTLGREDGAGHPSFEDQLLTPQRYHEQKNRWNPKEIWDNFSKEINGRGDRI